MVRPDGSFDHHSHMRGHQGWGMAHLASITKEPRLVAWSKRLLDFYLSRGTDYGWIPESMTFPARSETCAVADVIDMTAYMAKCGYPDYWDTVERFIRNYIREAQFFVTPEYEKLYRSLHPGEEGEKGLAMARDFEGGFQGAMGLNDRCYAGTNNGHDGLLPARGHEGDSHGLAQHGYSRQGGRMREYVFQSGCPRGEGRFLRTEAGANERYGRRWPTTSRCARRHGRRATA